MRRAPGELFEGAVGQWFGAWPQVTPGPPSQRCDWALLALLDLSFFEVKMTVVSSHRTLEDGVRNSPNPSTATKGHLIIIAVVLTHHCHIVTSVHSRCGIKARAGTPSLLPGHQERQVSICLLLGRK